MLYDFMKDRPFSIFLDITLHVWGSHDLKQAADDPPFQLETPPKAVARVEGDVDPEYEEKRVRNLCLLDPI